MQTPIIFQSVSKGFKIPLDKASGIKQHTINLFNKNKGYREFEVLKDISFNIQKGDFFGIVGRNGSGKSTLLKTLAGIYAPDKGLVQVNGSLTPFIELGVGFNPELSGKENVFLNGALLGFSKTEMEEMYDDIVDFAELHEFMEERLKNYSSGMQVRLAFSIAIRSNSEILLLDEVLAVGDAIFQKKCYDYFKQLKKEKKTVIFVSHDTSALLEYCNKGVLIEKGKLIHQGNIESVVNKYQELLIEEEDRANSKSLKSKKQKRIGNGYITLEKIEVINNLKNRSSLFTEENEEIKIEATFKANQDIDEPIYGLTIFDASGQRIFVTNNMWIQKKVPPIRKNKSSKIIWTIPNIFNTGSFSVMPAVAGSAGTDIYDQVENAAVFDVRKKTISNAYTNVPHEMTIKNNIG